MYYIFFQLLFVSFVSGQLSQSGNKTPLLTPEQIANISVTSATTKQIIKAKQYQGYNYRFNPMELFAGEVTNVNASCPNQACKIINSYQILQERTKLVTPTGFYTTFGINYLNESLFLNNTGLYKLDTEISKVFDLEPYIGFEQNGYLQIERCPLIYVDSVSNYTQILCIYSRHKVNLNETAQFFYQYTYDFRFDKYISFTQMPTIKADSLEWSSTINGFQVFIYGRYNQSNKTCMVYLNELSYLTQFQLQGNFSGSFNPRFNLFNINSTQFINVKGSNNQAFGLNYYLDDSLWFVFFNVFPTESNQTNYVQVLKNYSVPVSSLWENYDTQVNISQIQTVQMLQISQTIYQNSSFYIPYLIITDYVNLQVTFKVPYYYNINFNVDFVSNYPYYQYGAMKPLFGASAVNDMIVVPFYNTINNISLFYIGVYTSTNDLLPKWEGDSVINETNNGYGYIIGAQYINTVRNIQKFDQENEIFFEAMHLNVWPNGFVGVNNRLNQALQTFQMNNNITLYLNFTDTYVQHLIVNGSNYLGYGAQFIVQTYINPAKELDLFALWISLGAISFLVVLTITVVLLFKRMKAKEQEQLIRQVK